jgi:hypothetical protein
MRANTAALMALLTAAVAVQPASPEPRAAAPGPQTAMVTSRGGAAQETDHLTIRTSAGDRLAAPGTRLALVVDVRPKPKMHVYAPDQKDYIPASLTLGASDAFKPHPPVFPPAEKFFFAPLNETQLVYSKPFRIVQEITITSTPAARQRTPGAGNVLIVTGTLRYQACDDAICFLPKNVPLQWTIEVKPTVR